MTIQLKANRRRNNNTKFFKRELFFFCFCKASRKLKNTAVRTTIRDLLNAPETYKSQTTDDSAKLVVNTDATVEIPDVEIE